MKRTQLDELSDVMPPGSAETFRALRRGDDGLMAEVGLTVVIVALCDSGATMLSSSSKIGSLPLKDLSAAKQNLHD